MVEVRELGPGYGAAIDGVDLSQALDGATVAAIRDTVNRQAVVSIPGQRLTPERLLDFARALGPLEAHVLSQYHHPKHPEILMLSNVVEDGRPLGLADGGSYWHSDVSYKQRPCRFSVLYAVEVPDRGGDTLFADMRQAWDTLDGATRARLEGRRAVHNYAYRHNQVRSAFGHRQPLTEQQARETPDVSHPAVRTHPETGRRAIYVNPGFTVRFEGLPEAESDALKAAVFEHALADRFRFAYRWGTGDVLVWDNASVMHSATVQDLEPGRRRTMWRTIVTGDEPV